MGLGLVPESSPKMKEPFCLHRTLDDRWWTIVLVEVLLIILACFLLFLGIYGAYRRRLRNPKLKAFGFLVYTLSTPAAAFTLGLMQNAMFCNQLFPFGAAFLVVALGGVDSYIAHSLADIEQWKSVNKESAIKCIVAGFLIGSYLITSKLMWVAVCLMPFVFWKVDERARALRTASKCTMQKTFNPVADYMSTVYGSPNSGQDPDPNTMEGYHYLVRGLEEIKEHSWLSAALERPVEGNTLEGQPLPRPVEGNTLEGQPLPRPVEGNAPEGQPRSHPRADYITLADVWNRQGWLLDEDDRDGLLKDLCLSFSLFKLLCLKFAGYSLPQQAQTPLWPLIKHIMNENNHERIFRVIEVELAFLFDLFYTNFSVTLSLFSVVMRVLLLIGMVAFSVATISSYKISQNESLWSNADALVTLFMMIVIPTIEIVQFVIKIFSEWAKISYICMYVRNQSWHRKNWVRKLIKKMCRCELRKPWGGQLGQYSLLEQFSHSPSKCTYNCLTRAYLDQERDGQKEIDSTKLAKEVKQAIVWFLINNGTRDLKKGGVFGERNGVDRFSQACGLESTTHVILVWHVATCLCEQERPVDSPSQDSQGASQGQSSHSNEPKENYIVATMLSKYLAYLVAFAPRLLPDHPCRSEHIFICAVRGARKIFRRRTNGRIPKLMNIVIDRQNEGTIIGRGKQLGEALLNKGPEDMWKTLADFWVEMMLYVAPSNDAEAHAKYLSTGGEFVTHLWVLLSHAGIKRSPQGREQHDVPDGP